MTTDAEMTMDHSSTDIAIIGMSVEVPRARDIRAFWDIIRTGRTLTRPFPAPRRADVEGYVAYQRDAALTDWPEDTITFHDGAYLERIDLFEPEFFGMTPKQASVADPHQRMILRNMYLALEDAGYTGARVAGARTGVYVGFAANPGTSYLEYCCRIDPSLTQLGLTGNITTMLANRLSYLMDLRGPSLVVDSACSASLVAVHLARGALLLGDCDLAVVAGSRIVMAPVADPSTRIGIESSDGMTRTFDEAADGTGYGEGSGVVVLKLLDRAIADGDQIYAVVKGSAVNHDGRSESMTAPDAAAQARLLHDAWRSAGISPRTVGYLEAHGTATRVGDPVELDGLSRAFRAYTDDTGFCAVGTVKANIGHLFEGSGVMGLIKAALTLRHRQLPPLATLSTPNPRLDFESSPVFPPRTAQPWPKGDHPRRAGVSAFGLGGTNAHVILEEYHRDVPEAPRVPEVAGVPEAVHARAADHAPEAARVPEAYLFVLSARTDASLGRLVDRYLDWFGGGLEPGVCVRDICYTTSLARAEHDRRIAFVVRDLADLRAGLANVAEAAGSSGRDGTGNPAAASDLDGPSGPGGPGGPGGREGTLAELRRAYLAGEPVNLLAPYAGRGARTVWLPGYEFDEQRCWIDFPQDWAARRGSGSVASHPVTHDVGFAPTDPAPAATVTDERVLVLVDPDTDAAGTISAALADATVLALDAPDGFRLDEADLERVADLAVEQGYTHVVHALAFEPDPVTDVAALDRRLHKNLASLLMLGKALLSAGARLTLTVLSRRAVVAHPAEPGVVVENGSLVGLAKSIAREYPYLTVRVVDVDADVPGDRLRDELLCPDAGVYLLRGTRRYHEYLAELAATELTATEITATDLPGADLPGAEPFGAEPFGSRPFETAASGRAGAYLRSGGTYLVTGGTGGIGLAVARHFAATQPDINLVLLSRSGLPDRDAWPEVLSAEPDGALAGRIRAVQEMRALGATVTVAAVDVADEARLSATIAGIRQRHGRLDGIVHAAGVPGTNPVVDHEVGSFEAVLRPKLRGAFLLDKLTADDRPDFVLHLSSVAASMPALGQADYAAANFYLDNLAMANDDPRCHVLAIDWVAWKEIGMAVDYGLGDDMSFKAIPTAQGLALVDAGLRSGRRRFFAGEINYASELMNFITLYPLAIDPVIQEKIAAGMAELEERSRLAMGRVREAIAAVDVELAGRPDGGYTAREWMVGRCVAHAFGYPVVDVEADFRDMGADSITALTVATNISACIDESFDAVDLLTERTVAGVARFIDETYGPTDTDLAADSLVSGPPVAAG